MKTNIIIKADHDGITENCRVKLDSRKFPYIVLNNEKILINRLDFPREIETVYGFLNIKLDIISGLDELKAILSNPELTVDKLSLKQIMRIA